MKKITVENEQLITKRLINALERESEKEARELLNTIKKQTYNRQYRLSKKLNDISLTGIERNILEKQYNQAREEYDNIVSDINVVRKSFGNNSQRITRVINRININVARNEARKQALQELQKQEKDVIGVSLLNVSVNRKIEAIIENYVFNYNGANFLKSEYNYINNTLKQVLKFDFENAIKNGLTQNKEFASDDIFEVLVNIAQDVEKVAINRGKNLSEEEKGELQTVFEIFNSKKMI